MTKVSQDQWGWFATLTFRKPIPVRLCHIARFRLRSWLSAWPRIRHPLPYLLWSAEPHLNETVHIHALLGYTPTSLTEHCDSCRKHSPLYYFPEDYHAPGPPWKHLKESWHHHHGIARFRPYDPKFGLTAVRYITKYITKNQRDWDFWQAGLDYSIPEA